MNTVPLTLGTVQFAFRYGVANRHGQPSRGTVNAILSSALDSGIRSFDTAPTYGDAEVMLGNFLRGTAERVIVATKLSGLHADGVPEEAVASMVEASVKSSLRKLGVEVIDHLMLHSCRDLSVYGAALVSALQDQVQSGAVKEIGASIYTPDEARLLMGYAPMSSIQFPLNLLDTRMWSSGALEELKERGFTTFARSAFLQGLFALPLEDLAPSMLYVREPLERLRGLLGEVGLSPLEAALPYVRSVPGVDSIVIGVDTPEQLRANVAALARPLPSGLAEEITRSFAEVQSAVIDPRCWPQEAV